MTSRSSLSVPFAQWPLAAGNPATPMSSARSPLSQRLAGALRSRVTASRGRLDRLELVLVHTLPAGAGWSTDWRLRAAIEGVTRAAPQPVVRTAMSLRTIDRGALPTGSALDELWQWVVDTSAGYALTAPTLTERVQFDDRAAVASMEVLRHRVLRSAAVLERLPRSVTVTTGRRKPDVDSDDDADTIVDPGAATSVDQEGDPKVDQKGARPLFPAGAMIPVVRMVARFPEREGTRGDTKVVLWSADRTPEVARLLRDCAKQLDPRATIAARAVQIVP